jgi:beta-glucosidase
MKEKISELIGKMTLEEKASLCSGVGAWHTKAIDRLDIPAIMMSDGPHGLRKVIEHENGENETVEAVCFPPAVNFASTWNRDLVRDVGETIGEECQAEDISIILGPAANIKRSPLCGRNFEYLSEDPYLSSEMASAHITGVQSQGVGTSLKHFVANNQEHMRMSINEHIDERTLREIYLTSFEKPIKEAKPWTVMCAYNKVNGTLCSEHPRLLTEILRDEWGFEGLVVSDWGAVNERVDALKAGLELEMPSSDGIGEKKIIEAVRNGILKEEVLDHAVRIILKLVFKALENQKKGQTYDRNEHHFKAQKVAEESMVLLKNEHNILPIKETKKIAVIGEFVKKPRYQGGGSSHIKSFKVDVPLDEINKLATDANVQYAQGYDINTDEIETSLIEEAKEKAQQSEIAIIFAGLPERYESEGYDRNHMQLPPNHNRLIEEVAKVQENLIVVLSNGSPVEMPWIHSVKGVLEAYLGGQAMGSAIANLLFGKANPSGKLAETFPVRLSHNPSYLNFPGEDDQVHYAEGVFVGYHYYEKKEITPLFPFGYGLSYTNYEYSDFKVDKTEIKDNETLQVSFKVKNTGPMKGKEIVQLYVSKPETKIIRPLKELKGFTKVELKPGQEKVVTIELNKRSFAYYNTTIKDWHVEGGNYHILIGASSADIRLTTEIKVTSTVEIKKSYHRNTTIGELMEDPKTKPIIEDIAQQVINGMGLSDISEDNPDIAFNMMRYMPLRGLINFSKGQFTEEMLEGLLEKLNRN